MLNLGVGVKNFIMQLFKIIQKCIHTRTNIRLPTARLKNQLYQDSLYNSYNDFQCFNILNNWYHIMNSPVTWFPLHQQCFWGCPFHYCVMSHCMNLPVSSSILPWMDMYIVSNFVDYEQCGSEHLDNWSCVHIHLSKSEFVTQDAGMSSSSDGGSEGRLY